MALIGRMLMFSSIIAICLLQTWNVAASFILLKHIDLCYDETATAKLENNLVSWAAECIFKIFCQNISFVTVPRAQHYRHFAHDEILMACWSVPLGQNWSNSKVMFFARTSTKGAKEIPFQAQFTKAVHFDYYQLRPRGHLLLHRHI